jgi:hypothetical protein
MLYYYNARYNEPLIGRFISPDTIVPAPANPQSFNRYSYCLNNPLKYTDPSGYNTVVVEKEELTPFLKWWCKGFGVDIDYQYTIIEEDDTQAYVYTSEAEENSSDLPNAVYEAANKMRVEVGDNELNILWSVSNLKLINHYAFYEGGQPTSVEQYYINSRGRIELISSSNYKDPCTWQNSLRLVVGGVIMTGGAAAMYFGCAFFYCSYAPPYMGNPYMRFGGGAIAYGGWWLFTKGMDYIDNENRQWYNPFGPLLR